MPALSTFDFSIAVTRTIVILIGIIGSIISFIVFSRKTFRNNSISTYSRALAVIDCLTLIQLVQDMYRLTLTQMFYNQSDFTCKIFYYFWMEYTSIPGWILVAFSIDKMLNMRTSSPKILKSKLFQWSVVTFIVVFHIFIYSELLVSLKLDLIGGSYKCNFAFIDYFSAFTYAELSISCLIPFAIMLVTTFITIRSIWKSRERIGNTDKQRKSRDVKYAVSSVTFNVLFVVLKVPFLVGPLLPPSTPSYITLYFSPIGILLFLINCSSTVFIHFATNSIFRRELFVMLGLNGTNRVSSTVNSSVNQVAMASLQKTFTSNNR
jgi:hypothetical protein